MNHTQNILHDKNGFQIVKSDVSLLQNHLEFFLESSSETIYSKDKKGLYLTVNQSYLNIYQWSSDSMIIGYSDFDLFHERSANDYRNNDFEVIETGKPKMVLEFSKTLDNEIERYFMSYKIPLRSRTGKIIGVLGQSVLYDDPAIISKLHNSILFSSLEKSHLTNYEIVNIQSKFNVTKRQAECLFYLSQGKTTKQIAKILELSYRTVDFYIDNLKTKFDCHNRHQLIDRLFK